uniref:Mucin-16-like n=1 Tax=Phascolarctos cinereus TaxID=38626 RepID=A0A6P5JSH6_PHACI|nr:mucin-16-like [Phascolarctos cinereus]
MELGFPRPRHFQLNFTVTSVLYSLDLSHPDSAKYQENKNGIEDALTQLFRNSSIKSYFSDCHVQTFRLVSPFFRLASPRRLTGVDCLCDFTSAAQARNFDRAAMYEEFLRLTHNGTRLQNFTLDQNSILVDGYSTKKIDGKTKKTDLPYWAIILICLAIMCCFMVIMGLRKNEGDYEVQRQTVSSYLSHLDLRKINNRLR